MLSSSLKLFSKISLLSLISLILCLQISYSNAGNTIYIVPGWPGMRLFDIEDPAQNGDGQRQPNYQLKQVLESSGFIVKQADSLKDLEDVYCIITYDIPFCELENLKKYPKEKCYLFLFEPPSVKPHDYDPTYHQYFNKVYTWHDDMVDNKKYLKFYYPLMHHMIDDTVDFNQKKLCTMIGGNKASQHPDELYSARRSMISFFESKKTEDFDLYGPWWPRELSCYKGTVAHKVDVLRNYKFCICYENIKNLPGYITEKIFDCFWAGCIPVYWGAPNIEHYIPKNCFIAREYFKSDQELYEFIKHMPRGTYENYLSNIKIFLQSKQAALFASDMFVKIILHAIGVEELGKNYTKPLNFCTATDAKYFPCLLNLIGSIHKHNFNELGHIAIFDLGLTAEQKTTLTNIQKVGIYTIEKTNPDLLTPFNTRQWGKPVPGWYAWKPVAIKQAYDLFADDEPFLWIDAGTTVLKDLTNLFAHIDYNGYFFHNGSDWCLKKETTKFVIDSFGLDLPARNWLLADNVFGLEAGLMGISPKIYRTVVLPMYELSKDLRFFADDGTVPGGFGNSRHDLTLFSILALWHTYKIFHHFENPRDDFYLEFNNKKVPFHIACNPWDRTPTTHIYCSRNDTDLNEYLPFIQHKKSVLVERSFTQ